MSEICSVTTCVIGSMACRLKAYAAAWFLTSIAEMNGCISQDSGPRESRLQFSKLPGRGFACSIEINFRVGLPSTHQCLSDSPPGELLKNVWSLSSEPDNYMTGNVT